MSKQKVVIIEDYEVVLQSYAEIVNSSPDFEVVGTYKSCESALLEIEQKIPDFVLIDITLPGIDGIEGIKRIKALLKEVSIIVVTVHENSKYVFQALCSGAVGYLTKTTGENQLLYALCQARDGGAPMSIAIARMVVDSFKEKKIDELTDRENNVLLLLSEGKSYASIAETVHLSVNTIKYHVRNIYEKLHVTNKEDAIRFLKER